MQENISNNPIENQEIFDRIKILRKDILNIRISDNKKGYELASELLEISEKVDFKIGIGESKVMIASYKYFREAKIEEALECLERAFLLLNQYEPNSYALPWAYSIKGNIAWRMGDFDEGFSNMQKSLELSKKINDIGSLGWGNYLIGGFYIEMKDYDNARNYHLDALQLFEKTQNLEGYASCLSGLGNIHLALKEYESTIGCYEEALSITTTHKMPSIQARIYNDLGVAYEELGLVEKSIEYLKKGYEIRIELNNILGKIATEINLGRIYNRSKDYLKAENYYLDAIKNALDIGANPRLQRAYQGIAEVYKAIQEPWKALDYYEKYIAVSTIVMGEENESKHKNLQIKHNLEKSKQEAEIQRLKNQELREANDLIEAQTKHIIDSINYAKRIQEAILPLPSELLKYADTSFVLYEPKDIVSGDCYWFTDQTSPEGTERVILAAIDCTGHGVPGAFMVVMANSLLNEIVNEQKILDPGLILTKLDEKIRSLLHQDTASADTATQDGMDLTILNIDFDNGDMYFAGAKNSAYQVRNGEINTFKGAPFPIGGSQFKKESKIFETTHIKMQKGDMYYMATDGFQDQFGGEDNKKFTKKRFREYLFSVSHLTPQEQYETLRKEFYDWKGNFPQTDDVLVMGLKC